MNNNQKIEQMSKDDCIAYLERKVNHLDSENKHLKLQLKNLRSELKSTRITLNNKLKEDRNNRKPKLRKGQKRGRNGFHG